jgi:hypothetical protein
MVSIWRKRAAADLGIEPGALSESHWPRVDYRHWTLEEKEDLLRTCHRDVPLVTIANGVEKEQRYATPNSPEVRNNEYLNFLAQELQLGELEADIASMKGQPWPPSQTEKWDEQQRRVRSALKELSSSPNEVTQGDAELSQQSHAVKALELLDLIEDSKGLFLRECLDDDQRAFVSEAMAIAAGFAFDAGRHAQLSIGKPHERLADTGQRVTRNLFPNRDAFNKRQTKKAEHRRARISSLLKETSRTGGALRIWLNEQLEQEGYGKWSDSTLCNDLKILREKDSKPR